MPHVSFKMETGFRPPSLQDIFDGVLGLDVVD